MHNKREIYTLKGTRVPNMYERGREVGEKFQTRKKEPNEMNSSIIHSAFALFLILTEYELLFFRSCFLP
jgi:hypothetical protein